MRRPIIAANWKMHMTLGEATSLAQAVVDGCRDMEDVDIVLAPPFTALSKVREEIRDTPITLGAQNLYWEEKGAFTGEVSPLMLKDVGCDYAIVGHSERRQLFGETDKSANKKVLTALTHDLIPILCVGETDAERDRGVTYVVVDRQVKEALKDVAETQLDRIVIAYEPIWAIGTGRTATPAQAEEVHQSIRGQLAKLFNTDAAETVRILYGGSVKPDNVDDLMAEADIDGALVGGASLKPDSFNRICGFERRT
ncbi:MAG: triose-phosphate isomerase [Deltaproteobacteria bacterium]|nr:triose-phosphate isomerase [Deltaproteobacteria bacterium]